jgi:transcriptional regulator with XRE-family HTH domain
MKISNYLRKYRIDNGYSQEYVAEIIQVSQKTYSNMENDKSAVPIETIKQLIDLYHIDVSSIDLSSFLKDEKLNLKNSRKENDSSEILIHSISKKLIVQMEERIQELKIKVFELETKLEKKN